MYTINGKQYELQDACEKINEYLDYFIEEHEKFLNELNEVIKNVTPDKQENSAMELIMVEVLKSNMDNALKDEEKLQKTILSSANIDLLVEDINKSIEMFETSMKLNYEKIEDLQNYIKQYPGMEQCVSTFEYESLKSQVKVIETSIEMFKEQKEFASKFINKENYEEEENE